MAAFLVLAGTVMGGAVLYGRAAERAARSRAEGQLLAAAQERARGVARWRRERTADALDITRGVLLRGAGRTGPAAAAAELAVLADSYRYLDVLLVDASGQVLASVTPGRHLAEEAVQAVKVAIVSGGPTWAPFHADGSGSHLDLVAPVPGGGPAAAVLLRIDPRDALHEELRLDLSGWGSVSAFLLERGEGRLAVPMRHLAGLPGGHPAGFEPPRPDGRGIVVAPDHRGVPALAAVQDVAESPWQVVVKVDEAEVLAAPRAQGRTAFVAAAALLLLLGAVLVVWWRALMAGLAREHELAEQALQRSEQKFRAAFRESGFGVFLAGPDGRILEHNQAAREMLGWSEEELAARPALELVHPDDRPRAEAAVRGQALVGGAPQGAELRLLRRDGGLVQGVVRASRIGGAGGAPPAVLLLVEDVTHRKQLEARLMLSDRLASIGTLAAGVAHEINNPLSFVVANLVAAREALERGEPPAHALEALADAVSGAERVRDIVRDLKTFSREGEGGDQAAALDEVIRSAASVAANEVRHRARLVLELGAVPPVRGPPHRLGQVALNLLVNAAQAIPAGRAAENAIRVTTALAADGRVSLEVQDTGSGMSDEVRKRIFDPFFTTKPVGVGTGLGLSICHGIVAELGGEIQVESAPGRGSRFRVLLPAAEGSPSAEPAASPSAGAARRGRVLVVDDERLVGRALARLLAGNHDVVVETSAQGALRRLSRDRSFDLILCDLMMPEMSGMDLHAALAAELPEAAARMVFLTGGAFTAPAREFLAGPGRRHLQKPVAPEDLRELVARAVEAAQA